MVIFMERNTSLEDFIKVKRMEISSRLCLLCSARYRGWLECYLSSVVSSFKQRVPNALASFSRFSPLFKVKMYVYIRIMSAVTLLL